MRCRSLPNAFARSGAPGGRRSGGDSNLSGLDHIADLATTLAPVMEEAGVTTVNELAPATVYERMRAETVANGSCGEFYEVGAWARVSAG
jgi:hypothetical protein